MGVDEEREVAGWVVGVERAVHYDVRKKSAGSSAAKRIQVSSV